VFDVLADLTDRFEVLLVDQGSTDHTIEVAHELAVQYPQLRVSRRKGEWIEPLGSESQLDQTNGEVVFLHKSEARFSPRIVRRLWELCHHEETAAGREQPHRRHGGSRTEIGTRRGTAPRPLGSPAGRVTELGGVQMIRRGGDPIAQAALR
jgi:hypothetical protein